MTVEELIKELQHYPEDADVHLALCGRGTSLLKHSIDRVDEITPMDVFIVEGDQDREQPYIEQS